MKHHMTSYYMERCYRNYESESYAVSAASICTEV